MLKTEIRKPFEADNYKRGVRIGSELIERFWDRCPAAMKCLAEDLEACLQ